MSVNPFPRMHVSLYVSDLQKTEKFYTSFFGAEPVKVKPKYLKYILEQPSLIISFIENQDLVRPYFGHLGFQVETLEQLQDKMQVAETKGLISKKEIGTNCCYAMQDKFWASDPDGVQWEVYYFHADAEFNDPHYETGEASACCTVTEEEKINTKTSAVESDKSCCGQTAGCCN